MASKSTASRSSIIHPPWKNRLLTQILKAKTSIQFMMPSIQEESLRWFRNTLFSFEGKKGLNVQILTSIREADLRRGNTEISGLKLLGKMSQQNNPPVEVRGVPNLRSYAVLIDKKYLIVSSAPFSPSSLQSDIAIILLLTDKATVNDFSKSYDNYWKKAIELDNDSIRGFLSNLGDFKIPTPPTRAL